MVGTRQLLWGPRRHDLGHHAHHLVNELLVSTKILYALS